MQMSVFSLSHLMLVSGHWWPLSSWGQTEAGSGQSLVRQSRAVYTILASDWSSPITWPRHWPLIGPSRLSGSVQRPRSEAHCVLSCLASDWSRLVTWPGYWPLIGSVSWAAWAGIRGQAAPAGLTRCQQRLDRGSRDSRQMYCVFVTERLENWLW